METERASLESQVEAYKARQEAARLADRAAYQRSCEKPTAEAVTPDALVASFRIEGVPAMSEAEDHSHAWRTYILERLAENRVPDRYRYELTEWQCAPQETTYRHADKLMSGKGAIVALVGERGTGKTTIAAQMIIARAWADWEAIIRDRVSGAYWTWTPYRKLADLISRYKPLYADYGTRSAEELESGRAAYCRAPFAVIDELHDCEDIKLRDRLLTDILDRRYSAMRDTLLISNQSVQQFKDTTNDSILSRISEHGSIIPCAWGSWREGERKLKARQA